MSRDAIVNCHAGRGVPRCGTCRACRELAALTYEPAREFEALPALSPNPMGAFWLNAKPSRAASGCARPESRRAARELGSGVGDTRLPATAARGQ